MKRKIICLLLVILSLNALAATITLGSDHHGYSISQNTDNCLELSYDVNQLVVKDISTEKGTYSALSFESGYGTRNVGEPALPTFNNLIEVPADSNPVAKIVSYEVKEYKLTELGIDHNIAPAQPSYPKNIDPADMKFEINEDTYKTDDYGRNKLASVKKNGSMRGTGLATLVVSPFAYNPVKNTLKVYSNIKVKINCNSAAPVRSSSLLTEKRPT